MRRFLFFIFLFLSIIAFSFSAENKKAKNDANIKKEDFLPPKTEPPPSYEWMLIKSMLVLGVMIGGFYLFFKYLASKKGALVTTEAMRVVGTLPLGGGKFLSIVEIAGKFLLLGISEGSINLIKEFEEKEEEFLREALAKENLIERPDFITSLKRIFRSSETNVRKSKNRQDTMNLDVIDAYRLRVRRLKNDEDDEDKGNI